jgi:hypothetical protein
MIQWACKKNINFIVIKVLSTDNSKASENCRRKARGPSLIQLTWQPVTERGVFYVQKYKERPVAAPCCSCLDRSIGK